MNPLAAGLVLSIGGVVAAITCCMVVVLLGSALFDLLGFSDGSMRIVTVIYVASTVMALVAAIRGKWRPFTVAYALMGGLLSLLLTLCGKGNPI